MAPSRSNYVCARCGLPVRLWRGEVWKHSAGSRSRSCGKPPQVMAREAYDRFMEQSTADALAAVRHPKSSLASPRSG